MPKKKLKFKYRQMSAEELKLSRKRLGLTIKTMSSILCADVKEYKRFEKDGLRAPHDTEGPTVRLVQILTYIPKEAKYKKEAKSIREQLGYKGPEKEYKGVKLLFK
jgi:hypothetical protein